MQGGFMKLYLRFEAVKKLQSSMKEQMTQAQLSISRYVAVKEYISLKFWLEEELHGNF